jgi:hypothetical protein
MFKIFSHIADAVSSGYYRSILPANKCGRYFTENKIPIELFTSGGIPDVKFDAYMFHRIFPVEKLHNIFCLFENPNHMVTWEIDDDLFSIPEARPSKKYFNQDNLTWLSMVLSESKKVIVSTEHLKQETLHRVPMLKEENISVLSNLLSAQYYKDYNNPKERVNKVTRILWSGSDTHVDDLDLIIPAVRKFKDRLDVQFIFHGFVPQQLMSPDQRNIVFLPWSYLPSYVPTLAMINPDISLVPNIDDLFNRSKSNIKILETCLSGAVCIASETGEYGKFAKDYHAWVDQKYEHTLPRDFKLTSYGMKACSDDPDEWTDAIENFIDNARYLVPLYNPILKNFIEDHYTWDAADNPRVKEWQDFYLNLARSA